MALKCHVIYLSEMLTYRHYVVYGGPEVSCNIFVRNAFIDASYSSTVVLKCQLIFCLSFIVEKLRPLTTPPLPQLEPASPPRGECTAKIYFVILTNYILKTCIFIFSVKNSLLTEI